jgi:hypothetical protein
MFYLGFEFLGGGCLKLRRDLLDEGVVRKARKERNLYCGWVVERGKGLGSKQREGVKQPRVKPRGVPAIVPSQQQHRTRPSEWCP